MCFQWYLHDNVRVHACVCANLLAFIVPFVHASAYLCACHGIQALNAFRCVHIKIMYAGEQWHCLAYAWLAYSPQWRGWLYHLRSGRQRVQACKETLFLMVAQEQFSRAWGQLRASWRRGCGWFSQSQVPWEAAAWQWAAFYNRKIGRTQWDTDTCWRNRGSTPCQISSCSSIVWSNFQDMLQGSCRVSTPGWWVGYRAASQTRHLVQFLHSCFDESLICLRGIASELCIAASAGWVLIWKALRRIVSLATDKICAGYASPIAKLCTCYK